MESPNLTTIVKDDDGPRGPSSVATSFWKLYFVVCQKKPLQPSSFTMVAKYLYEVAKYFVEARNPAVLNAMKRVRCPRACKGKAKVYTAPPRRSKPVKKPCAPKVQKDGEYYAAMQGPLCNIPQTQTLSLYT